jgi:hypothetical protein
LASTTSSGAAALGTSRVFEIYRATSAEDLYRASMMQQYKQQQAADNGGGSGVGGITSTPGTPVLFNQVVQLRHFRSKKLLVLDIRSKAKHDSLSMEVVLRGNSGAASVGGMDVEMLNNSWFSLESANGFLDLGEVHLGDDFHFVSNRWNRFLHVAEPRHSFPDDDKEEMGRGGGGGRDGSKGSAKSSSVVAVGYRSSGSSDEDEEVEDGKGGETCLDEDADAAGEKKRAGGRVLGEEDVDSAFAEERAPQAIGRARSSTRLFRQGSEAQERNRQQEREARKQRRRIRASWPRIAGSFSRTTFHCVPYRLFEKTLALSSSSDAGMPVGGDTSGLDGDDSAEGSAAVCGGDVLYLSHTVDGALRYWRDPTLKDRPSLCCLKPSLSGEEGSGSSTAEASFQHASMEASLLDMWEVSN